MGEEVSAGLAPKFKYAALDFEGGIIQRSICERNQLGVFAFLHCYWREKLGELVLLFFSFFCPFDWVYSCGSGGTSCFLNFEAKLSSFLRNSTILKEKKLPDQEKIS